MRPSLLCLIACVSSEWMLMGGVWLQSCGMHDEDAPVSSMKLSLGHVMWITSLVQDVAAAAQCGKMSFECVHLAASICRRVHKRFQSTVTHRGVYAKHIRLTAAVDVTVILLITNWRMSCIYIYILVFITLNSPTVSSQIYQVLDNYCAGHI